MTPNQFRAALDRLDLSQVGVARLLGADERTARRWALGERDVPDCVAIVLRLMTAGKISAEDVEAARRGADVEKRRGKR
jgi:DNA-binding transcriptional regulator YiaG